MKRRRLDGILRQKSGRQKSKKKLRADKFEQDISVYLAFNDSSRRSDIYKISRAMWTDRCREKNQSVMVHGIREK